MPAFVSSRRRGAARLLFVFSAVALLTAVGSASSLAVPTPGRGCDDFGWSFASAGIKGDWKTICARPRDTFCRVFHLDRAQGHMAECLDFGDRPRVIGVVKAGVRPIDPAVLTDLEAARAAVGWVYLPGELVSLGQPRLVKLDMFDGIARPATVRKQDYDPNTDRPTGTREASVVLLIGRLGELSVAITTYTPGLKQPIEIEDAKRLLSSFEMRQGSFTVPSRG
jgi:hypothetical protein